MKPKRSGSPSNEGVTSAERRRPFVYVTALSPDEGMVLTIGRLSVSISTETAEQILAALALSLMGQADGAARREGRPPRGSRGGSLDS
jgi:hypothetical protein